MLQSRLFTKTKKESPKDEEAINAQILVRAGFVDKVMAGVYTFLPLGLRTLRKIEAVIREEMEAIGGEEILMPSLQPKSNWEKTGRWESLNSLFRFKSHYSKIDYALGPTHEEIVAPLIQKFVSSYKDLPRYVFQVQTKFRDEERAKSGLLRGREFIMKDLYSFHAAEEDLDQYYEKAKAAYSEIFNRVGIGPETYLTFASGGTFSKYSHEFQTLTSSGEDEIYLCGKCRVAVNKEIIGEQKVCPECGSTDLKPEKSAEVGNIFKLKTKYSKPFGLIYKDAAGKEQDVFMGCYGIGSTRLMGVIVEVCHDQNGVIWPESVAPFKAHLLNLESDNKKAILVYQTLQKNGIEVLYDDRENVSPGEKLVDSDLIGIPWRLVVGKRTGGKIEVKKRSEEEINLLSEKELLKTISK